MAPRWAARRAALRIADRGIDRPQRGLRAVRQATSDLWREVTIHVGGQAGLAAVAERGAGRLTDVDVEECIVIDVAGRRRKRVHLVATTEAIGLHRS